MPGGRHRPARDPAPGLWILLLLVMAGAALVYVNRDDLLHLVGLGDRPAPEARQDRRSLTIHIGGGVLLDPEMVPGVEESGGPAWAGLGTMLRRDGLTAVHLPCAVADDEVGGPRCDPGALPALHEAGVEVAGVANEYLGAEGGAAVEGTVRALEDVGIAAVGAGADASEATRAAVVESGGWRIGVLAFTLMAPPDHAATDDRAGIADGSDLALMVAAVERVRAEADVVVVLVHWDMPEEGPDDDFRRRAHALIEAGADAVVGHRRGTLQRMERHRGRPIFWSLDSLVRPVPGRDVHSALARVVVTAEGAVRGRLLPITIRPPGHPSLVGL